jgi:hypothetical protein
MAARASVALTEAASITRFITLANGADGPRWPQQTEPEGTSVGCVLTCDALRL